MLQLAAIEPNTLGILKRLMSVAELEHFVLVGVTSLALQYGHRRSVDLDLFSTKEIDVNEVADVLIKNFPEINITGKPKFGLFAWIETVKTDFINYFQYKLLRPYKNIEGVRLVSPEDIAAMKVFAMLQRAKKKDFWDMSLLLDEFGVQAIIDFYIEKYPNNQTLISIPRCLVYFDDAEEDEDPDCLRGMSWKQVKMNIQKHVNIYLS